MLEINKIYCEDCLEGMKKIDTESIDLVITSPPYNADKEYENHLSISEYKRFAIEWTREVKRILKHQGSFWLNIGYMKLGPNETLPLTYLYYSVCHTILNMPLVQEIVWHYEGGMSYKKRFTHRTERWQWYSLDPNHAIFNLDAVRDITLNRTVDKRNNPLGKNPTDYWYFDRVVSGTGKTKEKTNHPCQFPQDMITRIILACSNKGDVVLDPFIGSGTTALVSKCLERNFIGFEISEKYYQIAYEKLEKPWKQTS